MFSQLVANERQQYVYNLESQVSGYVDLSLCTNGSLRASVIMFSTGSPIIAMQIHRCRGGETPQTRTAQLCSGDAAVVFCGDNSPGLIYNAVPFPQTCQAGSPQLAIVGWGGRDGGAGRVEFDSSASGI